MTTASTATFAYAGVSKQDGQFKVRFANDALRVKVLAKNGHTDIDLIQLKVPLTKEDAVALLISIDFDNGNALVRAALEDAVAARTVVIKEPKVAVVKAPKEPKVKPAPTLESIKAKGVKAKAVTEAIVIDPALEDAPF